jgi:hypothetical protein
MKRAYANRDAIAALDRADYLRTYQLTILYDFPKDARVGLNLAFYRVFAIPRIANLLVETGEMLGRPAKRGYDTGLVMYELISHGFGHPRGREMVRLLNRVHRPWPILDEDYRYVIAAFTVVPIRWIEHRGWRPLLSAEREASATFYRELGRRMNIPDLPLDYTEAENLLDTYEKQHMEPSEAGRLLMDTTQQFIARKLPAWLRRFAPPFTSALLDDPPLTEALGLPRPPPGAIPAVKLGYQLRNIVIRLRKPATGSWFTPGRPVSTVYPHGYQLADLGPDTARQD